MFNFKKPLFIFSIVILSVSIIAGFFIRQKILNDLEISEFNSFLNQIKILEIEISNFEKDLEKNKKLKTSTEEKNELIEQNVKKLTKSIIDYDEKIKKLSLRHTSSKQAKGIKSISDNYKKLKIKIKNNTDLSQLLKLNELFTTYNKTISNYIDYRKNISKEIDKNSKNKEEAQEQVKNLEQEVEINNGFLIWLEKTIEKLKQQLNEKTEKLSILKNKKNN